MYIHCMLCTQEEEVSEELLTFHEVVNHMQEAEEEIIDDHRTLIEVSINTPVIHPSVKKVMFN